MLFKGIVTEASGSIGGITAARNRGGMYFRGRGIPVNPNTARQSAVRSALTLLAQRWGATLTDAQRAAWDLYGSNVPLVGPLGDARQVSGVNHYVRSNVPRLQAGLSLIDDAPTEFQTGPSIEDPTVTATTATAVEVEYTTVDFATAESQVLVYMGRPRSPGVSFFAGPFRLLFLNGPIAPPGPALGYMQNLTTGPYAAAAGQRVTLRHVITLDDGRLGAPVDVDVLLT